MARAIAICKGGPLDGQHISVLLDEAGSPPPLTSRAEVAGALYLPGSPIDVSDELQTRFYSDLHAAQLEHEAAFEYLPYEFTAELDENGTTITIVAGAAL